MHQLDRKDIDKPEKFSGDTSKWVNWAASFKRYLRRYEPLWPAMVQKIDAKKGLAITKEFEDELQEEYYWKDIPLCKEQLYCALESFTSGETKKSVTAGDEANVFSTWSRLADKGNSRRDQHVMDMQRVAYAARGTVAAKDLEMAIVDWEKEVT